MSTYRFRPAERYAVWQCHDRRCYLCAEPISYQEATVDHVVPESLADDRPGLENALRTLGLPMDFELNGFGNWLPAHENCNRIKSAAVFQATPLIQVTLQRLGTTAARAKAVADRVTKEGRTSRLLAQFEIALQTDREFAKQIADLAAAADRTASDEDRDFARLRLLDQRLRADAILDELEKTHSDMQGLGAGDEDIATIREQVERYVAERAHYDALGDIVATTLRRVLREKSIPVESIDFRSKDPNALAEKLRRLAETGTYSPVTDLVGVRILCRYLGDLEAIGTAIREEFAVEVDAAGPDASSWVARHFVVRLREPSRREAHLERPCEIQVCTLLQNAWLRLSHDILYKSEADSAVADALQTAAKILETAEVILEQGCGKDRARQESCRPPR